MLKHVFIELAKTYNNNSLLVEELWAEIQKNYSGSKRYYHNLTHLESLLRQLSDCKNQIKDWNTILFSVFYHDIIYNTMKQDNEEKSALLAEKRLRAIGFPEAQIERCKVQIIATKTHQLHEDTDTNLFTDADLSVLGREWSVYEAYSQQVRQEYSIYPDLIYKPGRRKVLQHFLSMNQVFKTEHFADKFEKQAQQNLTKELKVLSD